MQDSGPGALESGILPGRALPAVPAGVRQIFTRSGRCVGPRSRLRASSEGPRKTLQPALLVSSNLGVGSCESLGVWDPWSEPCLRDGVSVCVCR